MTIFDSMHAGALASLQQTFGATFTHDRTSTELTAVLVEARGESETDGAGERDRIVATLSWSAVTLSGVLVRDSFIGPDGRVWSVTTPPAVVGGTASVDVEHTNRRTAGRI